MQRVNFRVCAVVLLKGQYMDTEGQFERCKGIWNIVTRILQVYIGFRDLP